MGVQVPRAWSVDPIAASSPVALVAGSCHRDRVTDLPPLGSLPPPTPRMITIAQPGEVGHRPAGWWVLIAGGAALVLGAFLPWLEATTILGTITRSGVSYGTDALVTAGIGAGLAALGIAIATGVQIPRWLRWLAIALAAVASCILAYDYTQVRDRADSVASDVAQASVGAGLWLSLAGAAIGIVGAVLSRRP